MIGQLDKYYIKLSKKKAFIRLMSYFAFEGRPLTTKGRWINSFLKPFLYVLSQVSFKRIKQPVVFIAGIGRSGTTYLGKVLSLYPKVSYLNEPKLLWFISNNQDDINGNYSKEGNGKYYLDQNDVSDKVEDRIKKLYGNYLFFTNGEFVLDKYPEVIFRVPFIDKTLDDYKIILIIRNGWDTINSINNWSDRLGSYSDSQKEDWWGKNDLKWHLLVDQVVSKSDYFMNPTLDIKEINDHKIRAAIEYIVTMECSLRMIELYSDKILLVRYEDFNDKPLAELQRIEQFTGFKSSKLVYDYVNNSINRGRQINEGDLPDFVKGPFNTIMKKLYPDYTNV